MKALQWAVALLALGVLSLPGCADRSASPVGPADRIAQEEGALQKATTVHFTGTDFPIGILDPGEVKLEGGYWIMRDVVVVERVNTDNTLATGKMVHHLSGIMDANTGEGPVKGTFVMTPDADVGGGVWEGHYSGYRSRIGDNVFRLPLECVARGHGGSLEVMTFTSLAVLTAFGTPPTAWYGSIEGDIKIHSLNAPQVANEAAER